MFHACWSAGKERATPNDYRDHFLLAVSADARSADKIDQPLLFSRAEETKNFVRDQSVKSSKHWRIVGSQRIC